MKRFVVGFLFSAAKDRVVLIEKRKPVWQLGRLNGVGGKIERLTSTQLESPSEAMTREFLEETGCRLDPFCWECFCELSDEGQSEVIVHFFRAFDTLTLLNVETIEHERIIKADPRSLPNHVLPNLKWLIALALDLNLAVPIVIKDLKISPRATAIKGSNNGTT